MSSGFSYPQPIFQSPIYNPAFYLTLDASGYLTYDYAQTLFLSKNDYRLTYITGITPGTATQGVAIVPDANNDVSGIGALSCTSLIVNGSSVSSPPSYVVGIAPGAAANNKALVLGSSGEIGMIASLTATQIPGTLQTGAQPNITSVGTLINLTIGGNLIFSGASRAISGLSSLTATNITGTLQTAAQPNITSIGNLSSLTATNITGTLQTAAQPNITSVGTLINLTLSTVGTGLQIPGLKFYDSTSATYKTFNQNYYLDITLGGAVASKALVVDSNKDIGSIRNLYAQNLNGSIKVSGTLGDFGSIRIGGTDVITSSRHIQNIGNIACSGTMNAFVSYQINSVAFIDASRNISAASLSTAGDITCSGLINGFLGYGNQSNITSLGLLTEANIGASNPGNAYITIVGSGLSYVDSGFTTCIRITGSNLTPVIGKILISNGTTSTSSNAMWIGTHTANDIIFGTNSSTKMVLSSAGRLGIGTNSPAAQLDVSGSVSTTIDAGGSGVAYFTRTSGLVSTIGPLSSINVSVRASNAFLAGAGFYTTSNVRIKKDFTELTDSVADGMLMVQPILYRYKTQDSSTPLQLGYRAQDLIRAGLPHPINFIDVDDLAIEDPEVDTLNIQYSIDYSKIVCLLHKLVLRQQDQINELNNRLQKYRKYFGMIVDKKSILYHNQAWLPLSSVFPNEKGKNMMLCLLTVELYLLVVLSGMVRLMVNTRIVQH
ncbi:unnamed protein product [Phytophthora lilii]|uniref:Unnamed protein product n=1 Tax=Phytophthora lilii TaxID=2077276 RepID=A0A9W6XG78_9STRA|nr:unnamed protein product [Phytophthora lilii]